MGLKHSSASEANRGDSDSEAPIAFELVRVAAQPSETRAEAQNSDLICHLASQVQDWRQVLDCAWVHGIAPVVYRRLESVLAGDLPPTVREEIGARKKRVQIHNTFMVQELGRLTCRLQAQGIPMLALKGPALARVLHGSIHQRQCTDLDILVPHRYLPAIKELLAEDDYRPSQLKSQLGPLRKRLYLFISGQVFFARGNRTFDLDVHTRLLRLGHSQFLSFDDLWKRSRTVEVGSRKISVLAPEDTALMLCFHGLKNQWRTLKYAVDLAALCRAEPDLDWKGLLSRAEHMHSSRVLQLGLHLTHNLLKPPMPSWVKTRAAEDAKVAQLASMLMDHLHHPRNATMTYSERLKLYWHANDTMTGKARYVAYSVLRHMWDLLLEPRFSNQEKTVGQDGRTE